MKLLLIVILGIFAPLFGKGQPTFSEDIADIIYDHCAVCHRSGEIGPMSLTNYEEVSNWGPTIKYVTGIKYMPPWKADHGYSRFMEENFLTDEQIHTIADWVDSGMLEGDESLLPEFPDFPTGSALGEPDLILSMSEVFTHRGNNEDNYRYFVLPSGLTEDRVVKAIEFRPGNTQIVHHALVFEDRSGKASENDAATAEYGFDGFGGFAGDDVTSILTATQYPGYVPGQKAIYYPDGLGQVLHAGADIVLQIHYAPWSIDTDDQSSVNIFFVDDTEVIEREVEGHIMVPFFDVINDYFVIAPNTERTFHGIFELPKDVSLLGLSPHMHLLGKDWEVYLERQDGTIENLIKIDDWDFNWQGSYTFDRFKIAKKGDKIHALASYDNTVNNPNNPFNPPRYVSWGEGTTDEMYYLPISFVEYKEGDEDIVFGSTTPTHEILAKDESKLLLISPNPVNDYVNAEFFIGKGQAITISINSINGERIRDLREVQYYARGNHIINFDTKRLAKGIYLLSIKGKGFSSAQNFVKLE